MLTRRRFLVLGAGGVAVAVVAGAPAAWYGLRNPCRVRLPDELRAHPLVRAAFAGLDLARFVDTHVHVVGVGAGGTGAWVNPEMTSWLHPVKGLKFLFYRNAACITDLDRADQDYADRLVALGREAFPGGKLLLLAFDHAYAADGTVDLADSEFHVPFEYARALAAAHPGDLWVATSIHPYRPDALDVLDAHAAAGAVAVKWLPNAQRIDPADPRCRPFYRRLAALGLPLITHAGHEQAVEADEAQRLGNPLRLRAALEEGARVVVAHCASTGANPDLDHGGDAGPVTENFDLFWRLMHEPAWERTLFADVSAMIQFNRCGRPLREMLKAGHLHHRLLHGSDYPLPAVNPVVRTSTLVDEGYVTPDERVVLNQLFEWNALLFDFVAKRTLRVVEGGVEHRFAPVVFQQRGFFERAA